MTHVSPRELALIAVCAGIAGIALGQAFAALGDVNEFGCRFAGDLIRQPDACGGSRMKIAYGWRQEKRMNGRLGWTLIGGAVLMSGVAMAAQEFDLGKYEYGSKCASCHGASGKGDGVMRAQLVTAPSDLITLSRRNGGAFPNQLVWLTIDGRTERGIAAHGAREMPGWGIEYRSEALRDAGPFGMALAQPEWYVRGRIVALLDYLARMQAR